MKNIPFDAEAYSILIIKKFIDDEVIYEASVAELPSLIDYAESHEIARKKIIESIEMAHDFFVSENKEFPLPTQITNSKLEQYSGRLTLRISKKLHADLVNNAEANGISLNLYINNILSENNGYQQGITSGLIEKLAPKISGLLKLGYSLHSMLQLDSNKESQSVLIHQEIPLPLGSNFRSI